jgi:hypothetical protein
MGQQKPEGTAGRAEIRLQYRLEKVYYLQRQKLCQRISSAAYEDLHKGRRFTHRPQDDVSLPHPQSQCFLERFDLTLESVVLRPTVTSSLD